MKTNYFVILLLILVCSISAKEIIVGVIDFADQSRNISRNWLAPASGEAIRTILKNQKNITVIPNRQFHRKLKITKGKWIGDPVSIAKNVNLPHLILGSYTYNEDKDMVYLKIDLVNTLKEEVTTKKISFKADSMFKILNIFLGKYVRQQTKNPSYKKTLNPAKDISQFGMFAKAQYYYNNNNLSRAVYAAKKAIDYSNKFPMPYYLLSKINILSKDYSSALYNINKALNINENNSQFIALKAHILCLTNEAEDAIDLLKEYRKTNEPDHHINSAFGETYIDLGFYSLAIAYLVKATNKRPLFPEYHYLIGKANFYYGNIQKSIKEYNRAITLFDKDPMYKVMLAKAFLADKRTIEAINLLEKIIIEYPNFLAASFELSNCYNEFSWYKKSKQVLDKALYSDSSNSELMSALAIVYSKINQNNEADILFKQALKLNPKSLSILNNYAVFLTNNNKLKQSASLYDDALSIDSENPFIYYNAAHNEFLKKNIAKAEKYLKEAIDYSESNINSMFLLSIIYENQNKDKEAIELLNSMRTLVKENSNILLRLGKLLIKNGNIEEGTYYLERVVKKNPANVLYFMEMILAYHKMEWFDVSIMKLKRVLKKNLNNDKVITLLGKSLLLKYEQRRSSDELLTTALNYFKLSESINSSSALNKYCYAKAVWLSTKNLKKTKKYLEEAKKYKINKVLKEEIRILQDQLK